MKRNLKALYEQRSNKLNRMKELLDKAEGETRAFSGEEQTEYDTLAGEVRSLNGTIKAAADADELESGEPGGAETSEDEVRAFVEYIRSANQSDETRAAQNLTFGANGAIVPKTIANKIIDKVVEISPVYSMASHYPLPGTLEIPYVDTTEDDVTVGYADEFSTLTAHANAFKSITLTGFLDYALVLISRKLMNNSVFDVLGLIIKRMSEKYAYFYDKQCIKGSEGKATGILAGVSAENTVTAESQTVVTVDDLIDVQEAVPDAYQENAIWVMNRKTRAAIRKIKDSDGNLILNKDATAKWNYTLFGRPVYTSQVMDTIAAGKEVILYGDMSGLAVKESESMEIQILREKFADQHAVGVLAWNEIDTKVEDVNKFSKLKMAEA